MSDLLTSKVRTHWEAKIVCVNCGKYASEHEGGLQLCPAVETEGKARGDRQLLQDVIDIAQEQRVLGGLLAIIHGDGGHYQAEHGTAKAVEDAITKWNALTQASRKSAPETEGNVFSRYPVGTIFQKKPTGNIVAMKPDGESEVIGPETGCKHREVNTIADTHASWCVECGAFHDGSEWIDPRRPKAYGPGMTPHAEDCVCAVCGPPPQQFCPHCGESEPHTHRVPGVPEPVVFPSQVKANGEPT
jgi:hypothetical protein